MRRVLRAIPPCEHLRPLAEAIVAAEVSLDPIPSPYSENRLTWFMCDATFDEPSLRTRLRLPEFVTYREYDGRVAGSDATFACSRCDQVILGYHPLYAPRDTPRVV